LLRAIALANNREVSVSEMSQQALSHDYALYSTDKVV